MAKLETPIGETSEEALSSPAIAVEGLTKHYGKRAVVQDMTFQVEPGEVYALVGPNGAGKTTIIRMVAGLAFPSAGQVRLLGLDPFEKPGVRRQIGAVVEAPAAFYPYLTGWGNLKLHARLAGNMTNGRIDEVLELLGLADAAHRKVGTYSLGMRQRLGVAGALLTRPQVLILDEPASGMDPLSLPLVHSVLQRAAQEGTAVMLSTHHLDEVVAYCSKVAIIEEGVLIDEVNLHDRRDRYRLKVSDPTKAKQVLNAHPDVSHVVVRGNELVLILSNQDALARVAPLLSENGVGLFEMALDTFNLRAYYRERLQGQSLSDTPVPETTGMPKVQLTSRAEREKEPLEEPSKEEQL